MKEVSLKKSCFLIGAAIFLSSHVIASGKVVPETKISVVYPSTFDSNTCDQVSYSGTIESLALPGMPLTNIVSNIQSDPLNKRYGLLIQLIQGAVNYSSIKIEGDKRVLEEIEMTMTNGSDVNLTEFRQCAESDKTLQLVDLVNFTPPLKNLSPSMNAKIEYIRKNDQGVCAVTASKTLAELVKLYNPSIDLSMVEANASTYASSWSSSDGKLIGKEVQITFNKKDNILDQLNRPVISIRLPKDLSYTAIQRLHSSDGVLQMTGTVDCKGERLDNPVMIYDLKTS
jgi:hypothetical protein